MTSRLFFGKNRPVPTTRVVPVADSAVASFTSTSDSGDLYSVLADESDATYGQCPGTGSFTERLAPVTQPPSGHGFVTHLRMSTTLDQDVYVALYDGDPNTGGTLIDEWTFSASGAVQDYPLESSAVQVAAIDPASFIAGNLYLRFETVPA